MDWATVVSVAITGAVGIVGVGGTIAAAKIAGKSAMRNAWLADKRQVYARAIAALHAATAAIVTEHSHRHQPFSRSVAAASREASTAALAAADAMAEVRLIAPDQVAELASSMMSGLTDFRRGTLDPDGFAKARHTLYDALRADLDKDARRNG